MSAKGAEGASHLGSATHHPARKCAALGPAADITALKAEIDQLQT